ncbi:hypothetical protein ASG43_01190 [Aureimonas sp. Leaf454]|uniref:alpha-2-macroglobulin family protein n=1 Tax=Aureimonas sp. Leaf454 TaxID=1736381 RepID=UPI0006F97943|nr:MG2 domain-containing protein [Aureimonas sp. Leaf454]KQT54267.1 hypothetical protein ASG43_01190 [Aureimonas sp. Leaf454]
MIRSSSWRRTALSFAVLLASFSLAAAEEAERRIVTSPNADYFGSDYDILKDVDANICETACLADNRCQAFTLNQKTRWCFLKEGVGELRYVEGAMSGRIVTAAADATDADGQAEREADLSFLPKARIEEARQLRLGLADEPKDEGIADGEALSLAAQAYAEQRYGDAATLSREALKREPNDRAAWAGLTRAVLSFASDDYGLKQANDALRYPAAVNLYVTSPDKAEQGEALDLLAQAMAAAEDWKAAIKTYRASLAAFDNPDVRRRLDEAVASHGFRIVDNTVDNNAASPRLCLVFSEDLAPSIVNSETAGDYVSVEGGDHLAVNASGSQICVDGVTQGQRYRVVARAGILSASGEKLAKPAELSVYVRDRDPSVRFSGNAYVLPAGGAAAIPVTTVNTDTITARLLRIGDRELARTIGDSRFLGQMASYDLDAVENSQGEAVWTGSVAVANRTNEEVVTAIPVSDILKDRKPGVYVLAASAPNARGDQEAVATQWFILTDIGLSTFSGEDGFHVFARSLGTAEPLAGVSLELVALNNEILGTTTTDKKGHARFAPGLLRGTGGDQTAVLTATGGTGSGSEAADFAFLDVTASAFDLTDRGVDGREPAGALDVFLTSDRGIYRAGDSVHLTGLVRDGRGEAVEGLNLTGIVTRPDGVEAARVALGDEGAGGFDWTVDVPATAMRGSWRMAVHTDPKKPAIADETVLVEDFEPEKIDFDVAVADKVLDPAAPPVVSLDVRYLFGAPAGGLEPSGEALVTAVDRLDAYPGYRFGLADDQPTALRLPLTGDVTDEAGTTTVSLDPFDLPATTKPLTATLQVRVADASGRPVERTSDLAVLGAKARLGVKPLFEGAVGDGSAAGLDVIAVDADGARMNLAGVGWVLNKVTTDYQWYSSNGRWNYEPIQRTERVANGTLDLSAGEPGRLSLPVSWGGFELVLTDASGGAVPASTRFDAGWYVAAKSMETPDILKVSLDKPLYAIGDTAVAHIEPRFAGKVQVLVMDERVIAMTTADIPAEGADVRLPVTRDWGPGAYVTAVLYRPMDIEAKRMPGRAIGLAHARVDPGDKALSVSIDAPAKIEPRNRIDIGLAIGNVRAGETAYVTLAAVDVGILNITVFAPPAPTGFYFGKRRLGVEVRDLYSRLIDRMQGAPGAVRSGGDSSGQIVSPPPMEELVALFSGIVTVGADGTASVPLDIPDFNGTLKLMAVSWSKTGVGEASADMVVRDPVVLQVAQPRFLSPGDTSRIAIDVVHVEGPAGQMQLAVEGGAGVVSIGADLQSMLDLQQGARQRILLPVTAEAIGDAVLRIALTTPDGTILNKSVRLPVRSIKPEVVTKSQFEIAGGGGQLTLGSDILTEFQVGTGEATVSVTGLGGFDVAGVVRALDRYPYGCTEQMTSRALPLVYLDATVLSAGLSGRDDVRARIESAIRGVLANQSSNGSFGLWSPDSGDIWLDAYVTDFLTRAREAGYAVPTEGFTLAVDNLRNTINYLPEQPDWGPVAYAYYVLARNGRAAIGDLRYTADNEAASFKTPLAQAHLAAALALYGDRVRAETLFRMAVSGATAGAGSLANRGDYGTPLRDGAAVLTLGIESGIDGVAFDGLVTKVGMERKAKRYTSTQEDSWSLLAAHALLSKRPPSLSIDGEDREGAYGARFDDRRLQTPITLVNRGPEAVSADVTLAGVPLSAPPAETRGYEITRRYYTLEGEEADVSTVGQGDRLVAVVEVLPVDEDASRLIVNDPLPAGFEIDNPSILRGGDVASLSFLELTDQVAHTEFRADRFIASVNKASGNKDALRFAYVVRAVSPGEFVHPAATVEDMYRPERRGHTDETRVTVAGALR